MKKHNQTGAVDYVFEIWVMVSIIFIFVVVFLPDSGDEERLKAGYNPVPEERSGNGSSQESACKAANEDANNRCPFNATRTTEPRLIWVEATFFGKDQWKCTATYLCNKN